ncbi:hypothetical protein Anapl_19060 [Anas platyrhynchos]|uniref:Uncharacterized protein n=1 Tax=Anas platyrhynchos TaxID=8839 RepID=R0J790_ANAPL|nr:hypothetical protein Anapl_19060 [Anas platyrhynchos]
MLNALASHKDGEEHVWLLRDPSELQETFHKMIGPKSPEFTPKIRPKMGPSSQDRIGPKSQEFAPKRAPKEPEMGPEMSSSHLPQHDWSEITPIHPKNPPQNGPQFPGQNWSRIPPIHPKKGPETA